MKDTILIVGLGVIGAGFAQGLSSAGYPVYGVDLDKKTIEYALEHKIIVKGGQDIEEFLPIANIIILCVYPQGILNILQSHQFSPNQIVTDVSGVKSNLVEAINNLNISCQYVSIHPMAGREKKGILYADKTRFYDANFLIIPTNKTTNLAIETLTKIAKDLKFGRITTMSSWHHDEMIAKTSQLPHALAVALVLADDDNDTVNYIGDSYRDLTRIAMINHDLWQELFMENKNNLLKNIEKFEKKLDNIKDCLKQGDVEGLKALFKASTTKREMMNKEKVTK